ncbi:putative TIM-barrel fold metal-dependent hydrolase [Advenella incenata]|uniref:Putative TIM-barrel fold metal-dependent hydrolase n=1 Tax=Advenella incenata TaxID=267800 RepID=A0A4Q7VFX5_9BURK|nr:amidohydrolase family protein [Advenella incenata]RZT94891.1 putative TIM-barrel fold metal-dependent hydrolase [Advenella incenata]
MNISLPLPLEGACDCHVHVYGSKQLYPVKDESRYSWYDSPVSAHQAFARKSGISRAVIVQPSIYGTENHCTLDAAASLQGAGRAVVEIDENAITDAELDIMHASGARGVRLTIALAGLPDDSLYQRTVVRIQATALRVARNNWHIEVMTPGWLSVRLIPVLRDTGLKYCFGHVAGLRPEMGSVSEEFRAICSELSRGDRCYVKLSAFYRLSKLSGYDDLRPILRSLMMDVPTRLLWGTDFPHPKYSAKVTPEQQLQVLLDSVSDIETLTQILVHNPQHFYDFENKDQTAEARSR